ncbi:MAG: outer membrane lipoprotein-sorting protein [Alteromonadaceae bacterium]|nr:outer membrane lipoprotein-sorting protein [Alteromonadaceae bacterium]MBH84227.1 outer membrane lipoprotein-sorting protein [Alteromonadaceae bacterium]|tara:strand:+ start:39655 stop:41013 length:1359 start_codon:yes stop_codon:yes gene_type:complete
MRNRLLVAITLLPLMWHAGAQAKVSEGQAARLDTDLTPVGAVRAGNEAGTIPAWTGGLSTPPPSYQEGEIETDPFPDDKPLFVINSQNVDEYKDNLTAGQIQMIKQYAPEYVLPVYKTRRTAAYPERIYQSSKDNARTATLLENGNGVKDAIATSPFPIPENGVEVIWNHILRYRGNEVSYRSAFATPTTDGSFVPVLTEYDYFFAYAEPGVKLKDIDNKIFYLKTRIMSPSSLAGTLNLVHETLDQVRSPRLAWRYQAGERRLRRSPNLAYGTDLPNSSSLRSVDQKDMYNGAPNQYDWKLLGKREMYVPYNAYKLHEPSATADDIIQARHINQSLTRYELHRVWVIEANLRTGLNHIFSRRVFYIDEDSWAILASDEYDDDGNLWRVSEGHNISYYTVPTFWTTIELTYDLKQERYYIDGLDDGQEPYDFNPGFRGNEFTASAVRRSARR